MPASFIKSNNFNSSSSSPETKLFIAILSQAVHDAFSSHVPLIEKRAARSFLTSNTPDFRHICEMAGRDANYVREKIRKKVLRDNGWNVDVAIRISSPRRKKQMKRINKKHLTGNAYYAAKRANQATALY